MKFFFLIINSIFNIITSPISEMWHLAYYCEHKCIKVLSHIKAIGSKKQSKSQIDTPNVPDTFNLSSDITTNSMPLTPAVKNQKLDEVQRSESQISPLPNDVANIILSLINTNQKITCYTHGGNDCMKMLLIPHTLRPINFVQAVTTAELERANGNVNLTPRPNGIVLPATQLWWKSNGTLRLSQDKEYTDDTFSYKRPLRACGFLCWRFLYYKFDGINKNRIAIYSETNTKYHQIYILKQSTNRSGPTWHHDDTVRPSVSEYGYLRSCMLYPGDNKMVCTIDYSYSISRYIQAFIHLKKLYALSLWNIDQNTGNSTLITKTPCNHLFKKTVYLGVYNQDETFLGLTEQGNLAILWLNTDATNKKTTFKYNVMKHQSRFEDVAVDETVKTADNFRRRFACLNTGGEVFVCDLLEFKKPTLLLAGTVPINVNDKPFRLLYDNHQYAIIWKDKERDHYSTVRIYQDNYECHYAKTLFKYNNNSQ